MLAFVLLLFWRPTDVPSLSAILSPGQGFSPSFALRTTVLVLFAFMPLFSFFGLWDSYLSSSLYSGDSKRGYVLAWDGSKWQSARIGELAEEELNTPAYPEDRVFKSVFTERWCEEGSENALQRARMGYPEPVLRIDGRLPPLRGERSSTFYGCDDTY